MLRPVRTIAPAADLISLPDAKAHLRVDGTDEDALITSLIGAVTAQLDGHSGILGRCLVNQTWRQDFAGFENRLRLPFPDASSVTVAYFDAANAEQTVAASNYQLLEDEAGSYIEFLSSYAAPAVYAYRADPVRVTIVAGFGASASAVPGSIVAAAKLMIGHLYLNREAVNVGNIVTDLQMGASALLAPYRRIGV